MVNVGFETKRIRYFVPMRVGWFVAIYVNGSSRRKFLFSIDFNELTRNLYQLTSIRDVSCKLASFFPLKTINYTIDAIYPLRGERACKLPGPNHGCFVSKKTHCPYGKYFMRGCAE
ncbi:hypothetical protein CLV75_2541 [Ruegeria conchae]|uniref:Uncharacterized protein n=1 Tax=Ruegeria conchae TaxID=981384 RepID=A0A497ZJG4_9RHOB|nr:hypothetical protein CLV75_2541 [Ruegeria conchae]